ncbi:MAG: hypothetical protein IJA00_09050 [Bacteroidaceae bacterium]|nr:hypothetical protein [Bacteroidaceae bacterium]
MNKQEKSEADAYTQNMRNGNTDVRKRLYIVNDEEAEPSSFQRFFLEHPEINVSKIEEPSSLKAPIG